MESAGAAAPQPAVKSAHTAGFGQARHRHLDKHGVGQEAAVAPIWGHLRTLSSSNWHCWFPTFLWPCPCKAPTVHSFGQVPNGGTIPWAFSPPPSTSKAGSLGTQLAQEPTGPASGPAP